MAAGWTCLLAWARFSSGTEYSEIKISHYSNSLSWAVTWLCFENVAGLLCLGWSSRRGRSLSLSQGCEQSPGQWLQTNLQQTK